MQSIVRLAGIFAACLALSLPAAANDSELSMHAERFVRALQAERFDEAAAMFTPREGHAPAATAAQLKRVATRLGGFPSMRNIPSFPEGTTLKFEVPSSAAPAPRPGWYHQLVYKATAADGQPVLYILALDGGVPPQRVLRFEVHLPMPDAASRRRAEQALRDIL